MISPEALRNLAPGKAIGTMMPARQLGAPQMIWRSPFPSKTMATVSLSASG
ncbi:Uncharacterised protein [Chlamydia trachomatis]|nr:Uncharacterised protein [Chlamydia trachomatis]CRH48850.1 Uncharacterised protein [Chlamydia trachomatis]